MLAVAIFALTGLAAANPVADLVDCSDSFWIIACTTDGDPEAQTPAAQTPETDIVVGDPVQIDNDPICITIDGGFIVCHT